jgi:hypothetical protein
MNRLNSSIKGTRLSSHKGGLIFHGLIILLLSGFILMPPAAIATEVAVSHQVILKDEVTHFVLQPNAMARVDDGGFVIAGRINGAQQSWATKTDSEGKVLWRYVTGLRDKLNIGQAAEFNGIVAMPDGTTYLCGNLPRPPGKYSPGLLTHLDRMGQVLSERLMFPNEVPEHGLAYFTDCVRWGEGLAIVGRVEHIVRPALGINLPTSEKFYWLLALDSAGNVKWEKLIPTTFGTIDEVEPLLVTADNSLVFSGRRIFQTELFRVSVTGDVQAKLLLAGQFRLVRPVVDDGILQVSGYTESGVSATITLDDGLAEVQRSEGPYPLKFKSRLAYRLPDQSLLLFGSAIRAGGAQFISRIVHVDRTLHAEQSLDLAHEPFYDNGYVKAAVPTGKHGEFVTARELLKHGPDEESRVGAALDFIQIK